jgi:hypothetical protein
MSGTMRGELAHPEASAVHAARMAHGVRIVFKASIFKASILTASKEQATSHADETRKRA